MKGFFPYISGLNVVLYLSCATGDIHYVKPSKSKIVLSKNKELRIKIMELFFGRSFLYFKTLYLNTGLKRGVHCNLSVVNEL